VNQQQLSAIIEKLEAVQATAPTKTTYTMGRADHSMSSSLLTIIRELKALTDDNTVTKPETAKTSK
jgi:uncharacterized protein YkuJ